MGMDVRGKDPTAPEGRYFRANVWYWKPLWAYAQQMYPDLVGDDPGLGYYNSGYGLDCEESVELGKALLGSVADGTAEMFRLTYLAEMADLEREECDTCNSTGIRTDQRGIEMGQHEKALSPEVASLVGREFGWCNGCDGIGTRQNFMHNYLFDVEVVNEFGNFLVVSGGFEIW